MRNNGHPFVCQVNTASISSQLHNLTLQMKLSGLSVVAYRSRFMFFSETNSQAHSPLIHTPIVILFTSPNHALSVALQHSCLPLLFFNDCHHTTLSSFLHRLFGWIFGWIPIFIHHIKCHYCNHENTHCMLCWKSRRVQSHSSRTRQEDGGSLGNLWFRR